MLKFKRITISWPIALFFNLKSNSWQNSSKSNKNPIKMNLNQIKLKFMTFYLEIDLKSAIFHHFLDKIERKSNKILYYPLIEIHRKSLKIDNKFIQNQWKSMKSLSKIERKSAIFQQNSVQITQQHLISTYRRVHILLPLLLAHD